MTQVTPNDREDLGKLRRRFERVPKHADKARTFARDIGAIAGESRDALRLNVVAHDLHLGYSKLEEEVGKQDRRR